MSSKLNRVTLAVIAIYSGCAHAADTNVAAAQAPGPAAAATAKGPAANDTGQTMFKFGAFGTFGVSHSSERRGDYVPDGGYPHGVGRSSDWNTSNDTRIAAQVIADFTPQIKGVFQIDSEYGSDNTFRPAVEWANLKYQFSPNLNLRIGRVALPTFLYSDSRDVGYSYPWVHPPVDVYRQLAIMHNDGIDGSYRFYVDEAANTIKALYGSRIKDDRPNSTSTSQDLWGIFDTFEYREMTFRVGYQARNVSYHNRATGVTSAWVKNSDLSAGAIYDPGKWFLMGEWIQRKSTTKKQAAYISAGYRIQSFTPYLTYSKDTAASLISADPPPTATAIQFARNAQSTATIGARWDFTKNADIKLQYDRVRLSADSNGNLINVPAGTILYGGTFHVISTTLDFIF